MANLTAEQGVYRATAGKAEHQSQLDVTIRPVRLTSPRTDEKLEYLRPF
jgi:hypothetical protein